MYVDSEEREKQVKSKTTIPGQATKFTEYTASMLNMLYDKQSTVESKIILRTWVPTLGPDLTPLKIVTSVGGILYKDLKINRIVFRHL